MNANPRASVVLLVGNPKPKSRTLELGQCYIKHLLPDLTVEVRLFESPELVSSVKGVDVMDLKEALRRTDLFVIAAPTYKGSIPGVLKMVLDEFGPGELNGVPTAALMTAASSAHAHAGEFFLRPVLLEIGANLMCPVVSFHIDGFDDRDAKISEWIMRNPCSAFVRLATLHRAKGEP